MSQFRLTDLKKDFSKHAWTLKPQVDGKWAVLDTSGKKVLFSTLDEVENYYHELEASNTDKAFTLHVQPNAQPKPAKAPAKKSEEKTSTVVPLPSEQMKTAMAATSKFSSETERVLAAIKTEIRPKSADSTAMTSKPQKVEVQAKPVVRAVPINPTKTPVAKVQAASSVDGEKTMMKLVVQLTKTIRTKRLAKGDNFLDSEIKSIIEHHGCPAEYVKQAAQLVKTNLQQACIMDEIFMIEFENDKGKPDIMYFDSRYKPLFN